MLILVIFQTTKSEVREIAILVSFGNFLVLLVLMSFVVKFCHHFVTAKFGPVRQFAGRQKVLKIGIFGSFQNPVFTGLKNGCFDRFSELFDSIHF